MKETLDKAAIIDEMCELSAKVTAFKPTLDRYEALKEKVLSFADGKQADQLVELQGHKHEILITARGFQRRVTNLAKLYTLLKKEAFLRICNVTLKALEATVVEADRKDLIKETQTGPRRIMYLGEREDAVQEASEKKAA